MTTLMQPPLALYSGPLTLNTSVGGSALTLDPQKMQNPGRKAMWIDEVRFTLLGANAINVNAYPWGATVFARLRVNRQNVTATYMPIWLLSKQVNNGLAFGDTTTLNTYVYKPPVPIFVPNYSNLLCDLMVDPTAEKQNNAAFGNLKLGVVYAGREVVGRVPEEIPTPFAAKWVPNVLLGGTKNAVQRSTQNDLVSPFVEPLHVKSLIGRVLMAGNDGQNISPPLFNNVTLRIMNSNGAIVARDYIPAMFLFDAISREWAVDTVLEQNQSLIASMSGNLLSYGNADNQTDPMFTFAMHGYRNVPVSHY